MTLLVFLLALALALDGSDLFFNPPCECDLVAAQCDTNCCCDSDCSIEDTWAFTCPSSAKPPIFSCDAKTADWGENRWGDLRPLLCVDQDNNPLLGLFYPTPSIAWPALPDASQPVRNALSGRALGFHVGDVLAAADPGTVLSIPDAVGGVCVPFAPVHFLEGRNTTCITLVTAENLAELCATRLNASVFASLLPGLATPPPSASVLGRSTCMSAMVGVTVTLFWQGQTLINTTAIFVLADVSLGSLTQSFSVNFRSVSSSASSEATSQSNPGYYPGLPVLFSTIVYNGTAGPALRVPVSPSVITASDCSDTSSRTAITFQDSVSGGCTTRLRISDFGTCTDLQQRIMQLHAPLLVGASVAAWARPLPNRVGEWLDVLPPSNMSNVSNATADLSSCLVPARVTLTIAWAMQPAPVPQARIAGAKYTVQRVPWRFTCSTASCLQSTQAFTIQQHVRFVQLDTPTPTPTDRAPFYPLSLATNGAAPGLSAAVALTLLIIVASTLFFLFAPRRVQSSARPWRS
eukprot:m.42889 g.42889  ORF g.42889 m.42889 type:complete len:520 (-) comp10711_c0_seq2:41-1600(-)